MKAAIPLAKMSTNEKLQALEEIWEDLCRNSDDIPSPAWHEDVLNKRKLKVSEGTAQYIDWDKAKQQIRDQLQ